MGTIRQQIVDLLKQEAMTAMDLSRAVGVSEKDVYRHLEHIGKSMAGKGAALRLTPCRCAACGFSFDGRRRLTRPGRCPRCRQTRITQPAFRIK